MWVEVESEDVVELLGDGHRDVEAVGQEQHPPDLLHAGVDAPGVDDRDQGLHLGLVISFSFNHLQRQYEHSMEA